MKNLVLLYQKNCLIILNVLDSLLTLLSINDLSQNIESFIVTLWADDIIVSISGVNYVKGLQNSTLAFKKLFTG